MLHNNEFGANFHLVFYFVNFSDILHKPRINKQNIVFKQNIPKNVTSIYLAAQLKQL